MWVTRQDSSCRRPRQDIHDVLRSTVPGAMNSRRTSKQWRMSSLTTEAPRRSDLAVSYTHLDVYKRQGSILCWGSNASGQLGDGTTVNSNVPVFVTGVSNAVSVSVGDSHACARLSDSKVKCWGAGATGALGNGLPASSGTPVFVTGISTATQVSSSSKHTCARLSDGRVMCWGCLLYTSRCV